MKRSTQRLMVWIGLAFATMLVGGASPALAQLTLLSSSVDGGGQEVVGGSFSARCSMGEGIGGPAMAGGSYAVVSGFFNAATTRPGGPSTGCLSDINHDGQITPDDLSDFITWYLGGEANPALDTNHDGLISPDDFDEFLTAYFAGC